MRKRILFLDAKRTFRSLIAASILTHKGGDQWDIWSTPTHDGTQAAVFARAVLAEIGVPLLEVPRTTEPAFGLRWDEGVILCSGMEDT